MQVRIQITLVFDFLLLVFTVMPLKIKKVTAQ